MSRVKVLGIDNLYGKLSKIANIDLSSLATIEYVNNQINTHNHPTVANEDIEKIIKDIF